MGNSVSLFKPVRLADCIGQSRCPKVHYDSCSHLTRFHVRVSSVVEIRATRMFAEGRGAGLTSSANGVDGGKYICFVLW